MAYTLYFQILCSDLQVVLYMLFADILHADPVIKPSSSITVFPGESSFIRPLGLSFLGEFPVDWHPRGTSHHSAQAQYPHKEIGVDFHTDCFFFFFPAREGGL